MFKIVCVFVYIYIYIIYVYVWGFACLKGEGGFVCLLLLLFFPTLTSDHLGLCCPVFIKHLLEVAASASCQASAGGL